MSTANDRTLAQILTAIDDLRRETLELRKEMGEFGRKLNNMDKKLRSVDIKHDNKDARDWNKAACYPWSPLKPIQITDANDVPIEPPPCWPRTLQHFWDLRLPQNEENVHALIIHYDIPPDSIYSSDDNNQSSLLESTTESNSDSSGSTEISPVELQKDQQYRVNYLEHFFGLDPDIQQELRKSYARSRKRKPDEEVLIGIDDVSKRSPKIRRKIVSKATRKANVATASPPTAKVEPTESLKKYFPDDTPSSKKTDETRLGYGRSPIAIRRGPVTDSDEDSPPVSQRKIIQGAQTATKALQQYTKNDSDPEEELPPTLVQNTDE